MDVFAHTLWASAGARELNKRREQKHKRLVSVGWTAFWGVFPDLFAFTITTITALVGVIRGTAPFVRGMPSKFGLAAELYNYSHSLVIFAVVFAVTWAVIKRPPLALLGWALHILIDIPTHRIEFYPTPFLWPLSQYRFPYGISWAEKWFMIVNYAALALVFIPRFFKKKSEKK